MKYVLWGMKVSVVFKTNGQKKQKRRLSVKYNIEWGDNKINIGKVVRG